MLMVFHDKTRMDNKVNGTYRYRVNTHTMKRDIIWLIFVSLETTWSLDHT